MAAGTAFHLLAPGQRTQWASRPRRGLEGSEGSLLDGGVGTRYCATIVSSATSHTVVDDKATGGRVLTSGATELATASSLGPSPARPWAGASTWNHSRGGNWTLRGGASSTGARLLIDPPSSGLAHDSGVSECCGWIDHRGDLLQKRGYLNCHVSYHLLKSRWDLDISIGLPVAGRGANSSVHDFLSQVDDELGGPSRGRRSQRP